ncbi:hypothetical protein OG948_51245 (plasmid) [Embleya sp. NBC_00888]|uniref:hypothetical protein n=1 Tax=Embleya sp. NBC_00888 TaxID=2975960 RepID=UPI002F913C29|nr:hypothetical protein OG948_51245 [Embleya sp. NBC_00888]
MARPGDWSALGLDRDPTPGDPDRIDRVIAAELEFIDLAREIDNGLNEVKNTASTVFIGKTANAMRGVIDGNLRNYISTYKTAHEKVRASLMTYVGVMRAQQQRADTALSAAAALAEDDDAGRETHKATAADAKTTLEDAADTAARALNAAAESIASPVDECDEFWKALSWIAMFLVVPAIFLGGVVALLSIALNVALMIKTAIDFAHGKAGVTELVLGILGMIAPTTKGLHLGSLWNVIKGTGTRGIAGTKTFFRGGANSFGLLGRMGLGIDDALAAGGAWIKGGIQGIKLGPALTHIPELSMFGVNVGRGIRVFPIGADLTVINLAGAKTFFGLRSIVRTVNAFKGLGGSIASGLSGFKSLRLFLPVAADEMGQGLGLAFRIGFIDRGMFNMYRYGAFIDGKFIGAGSKITGGVHAGFTAFGSGGGLGKLPHVDIGGLNSLQNGPLGHGFDMPPLSTRFTSGLGELGMVNVPSLGKFGDGFHAGTFPSLDTYLANSGNLGAVAPLTGFGAKIVDLPPFSFNGLGTLDLGGRLGVPPAVTGTGVTALGTGGLHAPAGSLGHISIPNLDTVTNALPKVDVGLPGSSALVHDLPSTGSIALPHVEGMGTVALPQIGNISLPHSGTVALPNVATPTPTHVNLPTVSTTPVPGLTGSLAPTLGHNAGAFPGQLLGDLKPPAVGAQLADVPAVSSANLSTPQVTGLHDGARVNVPEIGSVPLTSQVQAPSVGAIPHAGQIATPGVGVTGGLGHVATPNLGGVPNVAQSATPNVGGVSGITPVGTPDVRTPHTGPGVGAPNTGAVEVPPVRGGHVDASPTAPAPNTADLKGTGGATTHVEVNGSRVTLGTLSPRGGPGDTPPVGPAGTAGVGGVPTTGGHFPTLRPAADDLTVFMVNNVRYDFAHTFNNIPGLGGVEVRVLPSARADRLVDIHVAAGGRTDITANHITVGDQQILRIEQAFAGGVHRWDYELSALNNHRLLDDQIIDAHVTGPAPGQSVELTTMPPAGTITGSTTLGAGTTVPTVPGPGTVTGPGSHLVDIPGLPGTRIEVRLGADGIGGIRTVGGADGPPLVPSHHTGPTGNTIVRVEQDVVPNVEIRRWDFDMSAAGGRLVDIERRITLSGGDFDRNLVVIRVDVADQPLGITHFDADGKVHNPGGSPVRVNPTGVNIPTGTGFRIYDRTTGAPSHSGLRLTDSTGHVLPMHVLTPDDGGALSLVDAGATRTLGSVTVPPGANGMFHVVPTDAGPAVRVFGTNGRFSHDSLPLGGIDGLGVPGGHIRSPHVDTPHLAGADGTPIPGTRVVPQVGGEFRIQHAGGQFHVDATGARGHDVVTLTTADNRGTGLHVFTPVGAADPLPAPRGADGTPSTTATVAHVDTTFHVTRTGPDGQPHGTVDVHTPQGAFSHTALPLTGGGAPGGFIRMPENVGGTLHLTRGDGTTVPHTSVTPQHGGGYLVDYRGGAILVDGAGARTHNVLELRVGDASVGQYVHTPVGTPEVPVPHPSNQAGVPDPNLTITRAGNELRLTDPDGSFTAHGLDGMRRYQAIHVAGGPFGGRFVRVDAAGAVTLVDGRLGPVPNAHVVRQSGLQGDGFRILDDADHVVVGLRGEHRFDAIGLRGPDGAPTGEFVFFSPAPAAGAAGAPAPGPLPLVKHTDGANLGFSVHTRPDGTLQVTGVSSPSIRVFSNTGEFDFQVLRLRDAGGAHVPQNVRVHPGGAHSLVDGDLVDIPNITVHPRDGGGFNVRTADGGFRLFDRNGGLDFTATPHQVPRDGGHITVFRVNDGAGVHHFDGIGLSDARVGKPGQTRFLDTTAGNLRILDGNLDAVPGLRAIPQPGGGYRVDGIGAQTREFRLFGAGGRLEFQRIDLVDAKGRIHPNRHFTITHPADGDPTWALVKTDAHGVPVPAPPTRKWFEGGPVDMQGAAAGRVHLISHLKVTVFERRWLPDGGMLDAHHSTATLGTFGWFNQRGPWAEFTPNGNLVQHGTRHWGESTRSWFDVKSVFGFDVRVRHFQLSADGGHVLAKLDTVPAGQSFADTTWVRYDADFGQIASGTRHWGPGRGWTDKMNHPITNRLLTSQEKYGRFQFGLHDVRRYHQVEMGPDGIPKRDFVSRHPDGNVNGFGKTLFNGDFLKVERFAEQRPPVFFRNMFSSDIRSTDLSGHQWLAKDNRLRVATWTQEPAGGGAGTRGVQFTTNNKTVIDVASNGDIVRETRTLLGGKTLTVGDVQLPAVHAGPNMGQPVAHRPNYLPWTEGAGGLHGHRTFVRGDFVPTPGVGSKRVTWQDRVTDDLADGDWYTPGAKPWTVVRTGFDDGTFIDYRPRPNDGANGAGPNTRTSIDAHNGDWTMYNHHGVVVGRSDSFPNPNGAGHLDIVGTMGANTRQFRWHDAAHPETGGIRTTAFERQITPWHFDRESFQDYEATGNLIRDHRQLGEGLSVVAWRGVDARGNEVWHWNKLDPNGNVMSFGDGVGDRVRHWFDADGNRLPGWAKGARWSDRISSLDDQVVQEIPERKFTNAIRDFLTDSPFRVRDFRPSPTTTFDRHVWQESDQGILSQVKIRLSDGTFLETNNFNKHARRYDIDGVTVINDRTIPGYIHEYDVNGVDTIIGRETHFTGWANEYRGLNRTFREPNRWTFGPSVDGEAVPAPFALRAIQSIGIDMTHEFLLDFAMNLVVLSMVRMISGGALSMVDVGRAAFGASLSSMTKGSVSAAHMAFNRGGWKVHWSNIDYGQPGSWRPNDDSHNTEWGANERPVRWRGGTYEFALGLGTGALAGFVSGASQAAIFGVRGADGAIIKLTGGDAALAGLASMVGGALDTVSVGALRTLVQHLVGSRWIHRQGPMDIFVVGAMGKLVDKLVGLLVFSPATVRWIGHVPDGTSSDNLLPGTGTG